MTDNTRALLEQALEALTCNLHPTWIGLPQTVDAIRAELAKPLAHPCKGIPRKGCDYLAPCDMPCNKCGEVHRHHQMVANFDTTPTPAWHDAPETIALQLELESAKDDYMNACKLVAYMHAAAVGEVTGPRLGVVEDVAALKAERDAAMKDAERYRWLRDATPWTAISAFDMTRVAFRLASKLSEEAEPDSGVELDAAIDADIAKTEGGAA